MTSRKDTTPKFNHKNTDKYDGITGEQEKTLFDEYHTTSTITGNFISEDASSTKKPKTTNNGPKDDGYFKDILTYCVIGTLVVFLIAFTLIILELFVQTPNNLSKYISSFMDLGKVGFGTILGLLGSKIKK